ncbi:hypothetical protein [Dielma fastidiosa]|uniref:hypothetical protein n=1 Tax=Dielma fastidiosa TaxID=1034346 RepID=UPI000E53D2A5|nr:hypothetical protein [Dielma fastidiosa]RHN01509.1 hypothetical protein DWZ33_05815 [Dielma fastidiosa]
MKYYAVVSCYYGDGKVSANMVDTVEADKKPKNSCTGSQYCDSYVNWFDSVEEAEEFVKQTLAYDESSKGE